MAAKGAGAPAERGDRLRRLCHHSLFGEVVATSIGRRTNHYKFALRTSSGLHPLLRKTAFYRTSTPQRTPAERANFNTNAHGLGSRCYRARGRFGDRAGGRGYASSSMN